MKTLSLMAIVGILIVGMNGQSPAPRAGISVQMPIASRAVEVRAADDDNSVVIAITADGKLFVGIEQKQPADLSKLNDQTVYLKADARAPYQAVLSALDALTGKSVVLIASTTGNSLKGGYSAPYGVKLSVGR